MAQFNGHRSWNAWNISLWINNDEGLYNLAMDCIKRTRNRNAAARLFMDEVGITRTPDGGRYNISAVKAAMADM